MNTNGYVIARNRKVDQFFTSRSSYDRPSWINVTEATIYPTAEMAQVAWTKLAKNGAYESRIVPVSEAFQFELPDQDVPPAPEGGEMEMDIVPGEDGQSEMVAAEQGSDCEQCAHDPCTCDEDPDGVDDLVDDMLDNTEPSPTGELNSIMSPAGADLARSLPVGRRGMSESAVMPAKPQLDATSTGNKNTVHDVKSAEQIKYKDPATGVETADPMSQANSEKITVPADVIADLKKCINDYNKEAKQTNSYNDTRSSFCMTVAGAFEQLLTDLERGDVEGVKMAQVHLSSFMSPITANLPQSVMKFIHLGGRKPSLRDLFDTKREERKSTDLTEATSAPKIRELKAAAQQAYTSATRAGNGTMAKHYASEIEKYDKQLKKNKTVNEATNHMGERVQSTYSGWKRACQAAYPGCTFRGDKDIGAAVLNGKDVGEWDGEQGSVYTK